MSGVVKAVGKGVGAVSDTVRDIGRDITNKPFKGIGEVITGGALGWAPSLLTNFAAAKTSGAVIDGASPVEALGAGAKQLMDPFMPDKNVPNIAVQDPSILKAQNEAARGAAARQAQIDQMTGAPGRGGTILTDKYTYRT